MFEILPPLWMRGEMFAMREFLTGTITSDLLRTADRRADPLTSTAIAIWPIEARPSGCAPRSSSGIRAPVRAMTQRGAARAHLVEHPRRPIAAMPTERFPAPSAASAPSMVCAPWRGARASRCSISCPDAEISAKLPVHLRYLPDAIAA